MQWAFSDARFSRSLELNNTCIIHKSDNCLQEDWYPKFDPEVSEIINRKCFAWARINNGRSSVNRHSISV